MGRKISLKADNTKAFIDWLNQFSAIDSSLVIEVDLFNSKFIAKSTTTDRTFACYSTLNFEDASFELVNVDKSIEIVDNQRFKLGILLSLDTFINILSPFSKTEVNITLDLAGNYTLDEKSNVNYFSVGRLTLKNCDLQMTYNFAEEQHFLFVDDNTFFNVLYKLDNPVVFDIPTASIKESIRINNIYNNNIKKDRVEFNFSCSEEDPSLLNCIHTSDAANNYTMELIKLDDDQAVKLFDISPEGKKPDKFLALKKYINILLSSIPSNSIAQWSFPLDSKAARQNRILIKDGNSYFCIGGVNIEDFETI